MYSWDNSPPEDIKMDAHRTRARSTAGRILAQAKLAKIVIAFGLRTLVHLSATFVERQR